MSFSRRTLLLGALVALGGGAAYLAKPGQAQAESKRYKEGDLAVGGFDPVAYFTQSEAVAGSKDITAEWDGATWRFASAENRDTFLANPEAYAPQYGGYCAYAAAQGYVAPTVPQACRRFHRGAARRGRAPRCRGRE